MLNGEKRIAWEILNKYLLTTSFRMGFFIVTSVNCTTCYSINVPIVVEAIDKLKKSLDVETDNSDKWLNSVVTEVEISLV